jgi:hypothetical protein
MSTDNTKAGKIVIAATTEVNVRSLPNISADVLFTKNTGQALGRASGQYLNMADGKWWQINLYATIKGKKVGYVKEVFDGETLVKFSDADSSPVAEKDAQKLADEIVVTDKKTFETLIRISKLYKQLKAKGIKPSADQFNKFKSVYEALAARQEKLKKLPNTKYKMATLVAQDSIKAMDEMYSTSAGHNLHGIGNDQSLPYIQTKYGIPFAKYKHVDGIGWVQIVGIIIVLVVVIAGATMAYYALKPEYDASKQNLIISEDLERALRTLDPETRQKVIDDLEKQKDDAYNAGKSDQWKDGIMKYGKWGLLILAGFFGIKALTGNKNKKE